MADAALDDAVERFLVAFEVQQELGIIPFIKGYPADQAFPPSFMDNFLEKVIAKGPDSSTVRDMMNGHLTKARANRKKRANKKASAAAKALLVAQEASAAEARKEMLKEKLHEVLSPPKMTKAEKKKAYAENRMKGANLGGEHVYGSKGGRRQ